MAFQKGVPRPPGAGIKKGYKYAHTLERERTKQAVERAIFARAVQMTEAQMDESEGTHDLLIRRPDGSFVRATDQAQIDAALAAGGELQGLSQSAESGGLQCRDGARLRQTAESVADLGQ